MRTRMRTGIALAVAGLASSGLMFASDAAANANTATAPKAVHPKTACHYVVTANTLNVRKRPTVRSPKIGQLYRGQKIRATCWSHHGKVYAWKKLKTEKGVPWQIVGGWVAAKYLSKKADTCKYKVKGHHVPVRKYPTVRARVIDHLPYGKQIQASCSSYKGKIRFWKQIRKDGASHKAVGGWVNRKYLKQVHHGHHHKYPRGWVSAGAGGTATQSGAPAALGGAMVLAGGLMLAARARRVGEN